MALLARGIIFLCGRQLSLSERDEASIAAARGGVDGPGRGCSPASICERTSSTGGIEPGLKAFGMRLSMFAQWASDG